MKYNYLRSVSRLLYYQVKLLDFVARKYHLDPNRIVNRALYGTDYDPDEVGINNLPRRVNLCC